MPPIRLSKSLPSLYPWVTSPFIVSAPMRIMSGPALAVSVSRAGGLGFIGPGAKTQDALTNLQEASSLLKAPSTTLSSLPSTPLPIGIGFQLWSDDLATAAAAIQQYQPCAAWLFAPHHTADIQTWTLRIREVAPNTQIWVQVGTIAEVHEILTSAAQPDVLVIQGAEAGGHGRATDGMGLMTLLPEVADIVAMASSPGRGKIPVFAAGGIADGRGASAALCLGAEGVVMGTRFLAATEARISAGYQNEIVRAGDGAASTTRTLLYNHLRGTFGWPAAYSPRGITNLSFHEHQAGKPFEELKRLHDEALGMGDAGWGPQGRLATYAGAGIGLIREVKEAGRIVEEVRREVWGKVNVKVEEEGGREARL
ncbi:inosine monophosphate dehydrogenase [Aspergillus steynii IBT 23096]|uniref:Inosine monophosphate dehydrogenase n=1 Tax=Aspergillus steynii IBT 23096 TaxID=1392250 RepID=A0A2I2FTA8_9EURO|nr:inosine monophosphate dehydrogenase [Aspergillus steynii IBT 23096]PLB43856.1 inosine monophosphate dehydrogenase [Aspergillus steynii IBT 23096]